MMFLMFLMFLLGMASVWVALGMLNQRRLLVGLAALLLKMVLMALWLVGAAVVGAVTLETIISDFNVDFKKMMERPF